MAELVFTTPTAPSPQELSHGIPLSASLSTAQRCGEGGEQLQSGFGLSGGLPLSSLARATMSLS